MEGDLKIMLAEIYRPDNTVPLLTGQTLFSVWHQDYPKIFLCGIDYFSLKNSSIRTMFFKKIPVNGFFTCENNPHK